MDHAHLEDKTTTRTTGMDNEKRASLLESSFDVIKEAYPELQDHDLNAIYR